MKEEFEKFCNLILKYVLALTGEGPLTLGVI